MTTSPNAVDGGTVDGAVGTRELPAMLPVGDVGALLACSARHVYRLSDAGLMPPPLRLGSLVRWRKTELLDWISAGCPRQQPRQQRP